MPAMEAVAVQLRTLVKQERGRRHLIYIGYTGVHRCTENYRIRRQSVAQLKSGDHSP